MFRLAPFIFAILEGSAETLHGHQTAAVGLLRKESISTNSKGEQSMAVRQKQKRRIRSTYSLWHSVPGMEGGKICEDRSDNEYQTYTGDHSTGTLERCKDHCESTDWCSVMSFHGDTMNFLATNVCVISGWPCTVVNGTDSAIDGAEDNNWISMNYSFWLQGAEEVDSMTGKHCGASTPYQQIQFEQLENVPSSDKCMEMCKGEDWCNVISYEEATNKCSRASQCLPRDDPVAGDGQQSPGSTVFRKGWQTTASSTSDGGSTQAADTPAGASSSADQSNLLTTGAATKTESILKRGNGDSAGNAADAAGPITQDLDDASSWKEAADAK